MSDGCSKTTNLTTIQQWNDHQLTTPAIRSQPKIALIERGNCSWQNKVTAVNYLSLLYRLNIEAMMIYDNDTHGTNISFDMEPLAPDNSQKPVIYNSPLPFDRNITNMKDNDVFWKGNDSSNNTLYLPVYFTTKNHGLYLKKLDHHYYYYSSNSNNISSDLRQFYQVVPFFSTAPWQDTGKRDDVGEESSSMLSSSRGYLIYILALVAIFIISAILLRWWKVRKMQQRISTQNEHVVQPNHILHTRVNQVDPLPVSIVNSLPIIYYNSSNVKNAICCICLDDYVENKNQVRILPCGHGFCVLCVDPWLTQKSTLCPICKYDCLPSEQRLEREQCRQQQQQQQQQQLETSTYDSGNEMDLSDAIINSNSVNGPVTLNNGQSTSGQASLTLDGHHHETTRP
ncbi:hypothetical protein BCR42DRAFT_408600 [Absidia repens]|uniref:RING-type domain-containing protein n=1 Tax=Absidia repens TaxID=90262 RepID=A0A1X2IPZ8_9FUNG|nr:hypothetical protein BCR42DRAFT_408600 [Absidia repens]